MSVYNPQTSQSLLEQLEVMSTDIRAMKKAAADAAAAAQVAQSTANTAQSAANIAQSAANTAKSVADAATAALQTITGTVQTISAEMVRKFTSEPIESSAFVLDAASGYFYATVSHMLSDPKPDIEVFDNDGDKQAVQSILMDNNTIKLELSANEMATNSFPLTCICLGKNTPDQPVSGQWNPIPGGVGDLRLVNGVLQKTLDMGVTVSDLVMGVLEAFICTEWPQGGSIFAQTDINLWQSFDFNGIQIQAEEEQDYLLRKASPNSILL
jgi:hypothetical protein